MKYKYTPREESATCLHCGSRFSYIRHTGTLRKHCSARCRTQHKIANHQPKPFDQTLRFRNCDICGNEFSYPIGRGYDRKMCSDLCRTERRNANKKTKPLCIVEGCKNRRGYSDGTCNPCYIRKRKTGSVERKEHKYRTLGTNGYVILSGLKGHPLANRHGAVMEHRKVLHEAIGAGPHPCHWCKTPVDWVVGGGHGRSLVPDHLDGNKTNNSLENLVPACNRCNYTRGMFMAWVRERKDDPWLWEMYQKARSAA